MSLIRPAGSSTSIHSVPNGGRPDGILSKQMFVSSNEKLKVADGSYNLNHRSQFYSNSASDEYFSHTSQQGDFLYNPRSGVPCPIFYSQDSTSYHPWDNTTTVNYISDFPESDDQDDILAEYLYRSPEEPEIINAEDEMRLKLLEIENLLLNDNEDNLSDLDQSVTIDFDWVDSCSYPINPSSPKESGSPNSDVSCISLSKDSPLLALPSPKSWENLTPKQLLFACASAISEGNVEEASSIIPNLRSMVSIQGDPSHRIAAYMVESLAARIAFSGKGLYKALKCKEPPTSDRLSAMQILFEVCPCFKFGLMAANSAIIDAFEGEEAIHIVDFDVNQGGQYISLLQTLYSLSKKLPLLRVTGVDDPDSVQREVGSLHMIGQRLKKLAESFKIPFQFHALAARAGEVIPSMFVRQPNEALIVNFAFQLHHMPDESVSMVNQRDRLLHVVKSMNPKLVTIIEQDLNTNTAPFFPRFVEVYDYYSAIYGSLDVTLPRESPDRVNVERHCLARDIVNVVACEGAERIERYEVAGKWRARMTMAGFTMSPLSEQVNKTVQELLKAYCNRYTVKEECGSLCFGWEDKSLVVTSAWR